jgi:5'-nucleotidase (lipoprotein e(P4) family)
MKLVLPLLFSLLLGACAVPATKSPPSVPAPAATPAAAVHAKPGVPADDNLNATVWVQKAVEHDLIYREIYRIAQQKLLKALHDPKWDALPHGERSGPVAGLKPAVILDVDETVLDNSAYEARLIKHRQSYNEATWAMWVKQEKARALPGALAFTRYAARHGITVFYLTNRAKDLGPATLDNLRKLGFPIQNQHVFMGLGTYVKGCELIGTQKTCRRELIGRKYRVLMQFGDQIGDFLTVLSNTPKGRRSAVQPYMSWFGDRWFVFPNPTYGSWEPALFGNDWSQPATLRRKAKIDSLRTN